MNNVVDNQARLANLDPKLREMLEEQERPDSFVYCGQCSHVISSIGERIEVGGSHEHNFTNPYGYRFRVGCYRQALGCAISGDPTAADTWFPGFQWRYASCEECSQHLGWFFANDDGQSFYGLIVPRIQVD
jgi:hypothetical protein